MSCKHLADLRLIGATISICALLLTSCSRPDPEQQSRDARLDGTHVHGGERLAWSQRATADELKTASFVVFVDDEPRPLENVNCEPSSGPDHNCSAPLPTLTPGRHLLEMAIKSSTGVVSPRSPVMIVVFEGAGGQASGK